jgi:hypothetical protein
MYDQNVNVNIQISLKVQMVLVYICDSTVNAAIKAWHGPIVHDILI